MRRRVQVGAVLLLGVVLGFAKPFPDGRAVWPERTLNVFAAASLKESFTRLALDYEMAHPDVKVKLNFAGSQTLAAQIKQGAPADVFASAAPKNLREVDIDPATYRVFARNRIMIAVRKGLASIRTVRDLAKAERIVLAAPAVPVGGYTEAFLRKAASSFGGAWLATVRAHIVSREEDVKAVLAKVRLGEADAGVVYGSDVRSAHGEVVGVPIPESLNQTADYPVAVVAHPANPADARSFLKFLFTPASQRTLEEDGLISVTLARH